MDVVERLSREEAEEPTLIALTHVHRYQFAAELVQDLRVLDLCCGSGYGSRLLAESAKSVHGVDVDLASIERAARDASSDPSLSFEHADALDVLQRPLAEEFGAIVLYEGLEHLAQLDVAVEKLRIQRDAGVGLIISLPNSKTYREENQHHTTDFDYDEAIGVFDQIGMSAVLFQFHAEGSLIRSPQDASLSGSSSLADRAEPEHCNHLIAVANLGEEVENEIASARMQIAAAPAFNTYMRDLERANTRLWRTNRRLARKRIGIADSAAAVAIERLRRADDEALRRASEPPPPPPPPSPLTRLGRAMKRLIALMAPHGLIVWQQRLRQAADDDPAE